MELIGLVPSTQENPSSWCFSLSCPVLMEPPPLPGTPTLFDLPVLCFNTKQPQPSGVHVLMYSFFPSLASDVVIPSLRGSYGVRQQSPKATASYNPAGAYRAFPIYSGPPLWGLGLLGASAP